jgi:hypothetical protein
MLGSVGSRRVTLRVDGPGEVDDSKETNIVVALLTINARGKMEAQLKMMLGTWSEG